MLQWNELRITPDGRFLVVDVEVQHLDYYKDVYLEIVKLDIFKKPEDFIDGFPTEEAVVLWEPEIITTYEPYTREDRDATTVGTHFWTVNSQSPSGYEEHIASESDVEGIKAGMVPAYKQIIGPQKVKHIRRLVDLENTSIPKDSLFFVYAIADGEATPDTPCGAKSKLLMGVTYNKELLYRNSIDALSTMDECNPSKELIDYILNNMAFKMSLEVGDYRGAIRYWNKGFKNPVTVKHNCGCHGY